MKNGLLAQITLPKNPAPIGPHDIDLSNPNLTVGDIIGKFLPYVYVIAGLILLVILIMGGIILMTAAGDQNKTKEGYGMLQSGLVGFLIIFVAYFVTQLVEVVLGVKIF